MVVKPRVREMVVRSGEAVRVHLRHQVRVLVVDARREGRPGLRHLHPIVDVQHVGRPDLKKNTLRKERVSKGFSKK